MLLDRASLRIQMTVVISIVIHLFFLNIFGSRKFGKAPKHIKLTEIQYLEEISQPTEMEKLMTKLVTSSQPASKAVSAPSQSEAIAELQKESFNKVVGIEKQVGADEITEMDLTRLAALPALSAIDKVPAPVVQKVPKRIALERSRSSAVELLKNRVVSLEELPPADFGPKISRQKFQQPELIIKKVKAERRQKAFAIKKTKQLSLSRNTFISGEIKNREILHQEFPVVPRWLEEKGIEAEVTIRFVVNPDGEVGNKLFIEKTSGYAELDRLAMETLKKFLFAPLPLTVRQVEQKGTIVIRFTFRR